MQSRSVLVVVHGSAPAGAAAEMVARPPGRFVAYLRARGFPVSFPWKRRSGTTDFRNTLEGILPRYRGTPIGHLLEFHNLQRPYDSYTQAELLIGMCMDNRKHLSIPDNFAYILRAGGPNMRASEFQVSYAIAVGGVRSIALIGHTHCGMMNLMGRRRSFIDGLVEGAGWDRASAEDHFCHFSPIFEIGSEIDFVCSETHRLRLRYPKIAVAPMLYRLEDNRLYLIDE